MLTRQSGQPAAIFSNLGRIALHNHGRTILLSVLPHRPAAMKSPSLSPEAVQRPGLLVNKGCYHPLSDRPSGRELRIQPVGNSAQESQVMTSDIVTIEPREFAAADRGGRPPSVIEQAGNAARLPANLTGHTFRATTITELTRPGHQPGRCATPGGPRRPADHPALRPPKA